MTATATPRIVPFGRLLKAVEAKTYNDAAGALDLARQRAGAIAAEAVTEAEILRAAARERGLAEGRAEIATELAWAAAGAHAAIESLSGEIAEAIGAGIARVIGTLDVREAVALAARVAVESLKARHALTVRVAPDAMPGVRAALADHPWVEVSADPALAPDDCVIASEAGTVQAGLTRQIDAIRSALAATASGEAA